MILATIIRDLKLTYNNIGQILNNVIFFIIASSIFAIISAKTNILYHLTGQISIIWFCLLFSIIIGINNFLKDDYEDGTLEQILIKPNEFEIFIFAKFISNWLIYCLPLILFTPFIILILKINFDLWLQIMLVATITTLIINSIGCFCASLMLANNKNESLLSILILPLIIPVIIFANSAYIVKNDNNFLDSIIFLSLIFSFLAPILVFASSFAIKIIVKN